MGTEQPGPPQILLVSLHPGLGPLSFCCRQPTHGARSSGRQNSPEVPTAGARPHRGISPRRPLLSVVWNCVLAWLPAPSGASNTLFIQSVIDCSLTSRDRETDRESSPNTGSFPKRSGRLDLGQVSLPGEQQRRTGWSPVLCGPGCSTAGAHRPGTAAEDGPRACLPPCHP